MTSSIQQDFVVQGCQPDTISSISWSPRANVFAASSWNNEIRVWSFSQGKAAPKDGNSLFSGSCDKTVKQWALDSKNARVVAQHDAPVKEVRWIQERNLLLTGSWDKSLRYWDLRSNKPVRTIQLPERLYAMDCTYPLLTVACANRKCAIFNLTNPDTFDSPLKMQTRCIANFKDKSCFAIGSIEGRVSVHAHFAFKCHRIDNPKGYAEVYAVNSIACANRGHFATVGGDGTFCFWNRDNRSRSIISNRAPQSMTCCAFNANSSFFAYAIGYDWSKGIQHYDRNKPTMLLVHAVKQGDFQ